MPFRYRGYYYDSETGLYYLNNRYYDSETGRFLNTDTVDVLGVTKTNQSYNLFSYCENNPINHKDQNGMLNYYQNQLATFYLGINYFKTLFASSKEKKDYIYNQNVGFISTLIYGGRKIRENGCELIAAYNVLKFYNKQMALYNIIYYAETHDWYILPIFPYPDGYFGTDPSKMYQLFTEKKLKYSYYVDYESKSFEKDIKSGKICIASYSNRESNLIESFVIHTFAFYYDKKTKMFNVFNGYSTNSNNVNTYKTYSDLRKEGRFFLYGYIFK